MKKKLIYFLYSTSLILGISGCESFVNQVDEVDPTAPIDASLSQVMNSAQVSYIGFFEGDLARLAGMWSGQFTGADRQYVSLNDYVSVSADYDAAWANIYSSTLKSLRIAQAKAAEGNNLRALALAQILEAHTMGTAASLFGDIPYSQSVNFANFPNPKFDTQTEVYNAVLVLLDEAIDNINNAPTGTTYSGNIFGGGDDKWIEVANTLKAKFNLHLGNYPAALAAANLGISSDANEIVASHGTGYGQDFNVYYSFLVYDRPGYMSASEAFAPFLLEDPDESGSRSRWNDKTDESGRFNYVYLDSFAIYNAGYELNYLSGYDWGEADGFFGTETSFGLLTYRENMLIRAEAELRVNGAAAALGVLNEYRAYLDNGGYINPDYVAAYGGFYDAYILADFAPGGMENVDNIGADEALYREIIEEKYVSLIGQLESFNDLRRRGFGTLADDQNWEILGITPNQGSDIPQRFLISQNEINANTSVPANLPGLFDKTVVFQ